MAVKAATTTSLYIPEDFRLVTTSTWLSQPAHRRELDETVGPDLTNNHFHSITFTLVYFCIHVKKHLTSFMLHYQWVLKVVLVRKDEVLPSWNCTDYVSLWSCDDSWSRSASQSLQQSNSINSSHTSVLWCQTIGHYMHASSTDTRKRKLVVNLLPMFLCIAKKVA